MYAYTYIYVYWLVGDGLARPAYYDLRRRRSRLKVFKQKTLTKYIYIYIYMYICKYRMRDTAGKPVGDLFWVGGQLGGVWLAVWGWLGGLGFLTQSLAGRGPGKGEVGPGERCEKCEKCENAK